MRKIIAGLFFQKTKVWFLWLAFCFLLFSLTRLTKSLDLINEWGASWGDIALELGFFYFLILIEVMIASMILGGLQIGLEKALHTNLDIFAKIILVCALIVPFVNLALVIFKLPAI